MAEDSPIAKLAAMSLQKQVAVLVGVMFFVFFLYYQLYYSSMEEELSGAESQYTRHEKTAKDLKTKKVEYDKMVKEQEALDIKLRTNQISLPATADLASFVDHLQREAAVAGVTLNWSRLAEKPVPGYVKVPVKVNIQGTYHQILKYQYLLGKTKRIITIEDFSLVPVPNKSDDIQLKSSFTATTFRLPDGAVPKKLPPTKSGMIDKAKDAREKKEKSVEDVTGGKTDEAGNPTDKASVDRLKNAGSN